MKISKWMSLLAIMIWCASVAAADDSAPAAARPAITEQYVMLYYEDLEAPAAFYGDLLGLEAVMDEEWVKLYRVLPHSFIGVNKGGEEGKTWHQPQEHNAVMVSIVTEDVDAWYEVIKQSEVEILKDIHNHPSVPIRAFLVADPGGYTVEFFQWLER